MTQTFGRRARRAALMFAVAAVGGLAVSSCTVPNPAEGIGFREARYNEMTTIRTWQTCRDQAVDLDHQAHDEASAARYLAAAKLLEKCESDVGPESAKINADERMRSYALAVQDYLKGGDIPAARDSLGKLRTAFPGADLYYANGASFIDTMDFLTGVKDRAAVGELGVSNVDDGFKAELRRAQYWTHN